MPSHVPILVKIMGCLVNCQKESFDTRHGGEMEGVAKLEPVYEKADHAVSILRPHVYHHSNLLERDRDEDPSAHTVPTVGPLPGYLL